MEGSNGSIGAHIRNYLLFKRLTTPSCLHESLSFSVGSVVLGLNDENGPHNDAHEVNQPVGHIVEESVLKTGDDSNAVKRVHLDIYLMFVVELIHLFVRAACSEHGQARCPTTSPCTCKA